MLNVNLCDFDIQEFFGTTNTLSIYWTDSSKKDLLVNTIQEVGWSCSVEGQFKRIDIRVIGCTNKEAVEAIAQWMSEQGMTYRLI